MQEQVSSQVNSLERNSSEPNTLENMVFPAIPFPEKIMAKCLRLLSMKLYGETFTVKEVEALNGMIDTIGDFLTPKFPNYIISHISEGKFGSFRSGNIVILINDTMKISLYFGNSISGCFEIATTGCYHPVIQYNEKNRLNMFLYNWNSDGSQKVKFRGEDLLNFINELVPCD